MNNRPVSAPAKATIIDHSLSVRLKLPAVSIARRWGFLRLVKCSPRGAAGHHVQSLAVKLAHPVDGANRFRIAGELVEFLEQCTAIVDAIVGRVVSMCSGDIVPVTPDLSDVRQQ